jgi:hypothetical protein
MIIFFGFGILLVGTVFVWGGITGTAPAVLAAVFDPSVLTGNVAAPKLSNNTPVGELHSGGPLGQAGREASKLLHRVGL